MYHIKKDKRVQESAKLIIEGLNRCLKTKKFEEITITDVQIESTVGRATFYRLFDSLKDVLTYECDITFAELMKSSSKEKTTIDRIAAFINGWIYVSDLLEVIVESGNLDIIYHSHLYYLDSLKEDLLVEKNYKESDKEYIVGVLTSMMVGILISWLKGGKKESSKDLTEILKRAIKFSNDLIIGV